MIIMKFGTQLVFMYSLAKSVTRGQNPSVMGNRENVSVKNLNNFLMRQYSSPASNFKSKWILSASSNALLSPISLPQTSLDCFLGLINSSPSH